MAWRLNGIGGFRLSCRAMLQAGLLALALPAFAQRHLLDAAVLSVSGLVVFLRPRAAPYLAVLAVLLPSSATSALTTDGLVLAGAAAGLALDRLRRGDWRLAPVPTGPLVLLAALDALMLLSMAWNRDAAQATTYFVSRTILAGAVVVLAGAAPRVRRDWLAAAALGAVPLALARLLELGGVPLQSALGDRLSVQIMGDLGQLGTWNIFACVVAVAGLVALGAGLSSARSSTTVAGLALAALLLVSAATAGSRTVLVAVLAVLGALVLAAGERRGRAVVGVMAAAFLAASALPGSPLVDKPLLVSTRDATAAPPSSDASAGPRPGTGEAASGARFAPPPGLAADWRVVLDQPYYRLDQTFVRPSVRPTGNFLAILVRAGTKTRSVLLRVSVDGAVVGDLSAAELDASYRWVTMPLPDGLLAGGRDVVVSLAARGDLDSQRRYISVGATDALSPAIRTSAFSQGHAVPGDLSADPGHQQGTALVFLDGQVPDLHRPPAGAQRVVQESIADRLTLWRTAWHVFLRHPLLGTGFYTFGSARFEDPEGNLFTPYANAHSNLLELLSDLGPLGPALFLLLLLSAGVALLGWPPTTWAAGAGPDRWWRLGWAGAVGIMLVASLTQTWLADSRSAVFFWLLLLAAGATRSPASASR